MQCHVCAGLANRSCTLCGRPFCPTHGGMRKRGEDAGKSYHIVTRALCDDCTPNQAWLLIYRPIVVFILIACFFAAVYFFLIKPDLERSQQRRQKHNRQSEEWQQPQQGFNK